MTHRVMLPAAALLCLALVASSAQLQVPRCCKDGQRLEVSQLPPEPSAQQVAAACLAAPGAVWAPPIYAPVRGTMLPKNFVPKHWIAAESALPVCDVLRVLSDLTAPYVLLANNASLWLRNAGRSLSPPRYCVDISGAVVCAEDSQHAPSKCCGPGRKWDGGSHCVDDEKASAEAEHELEALAGRKPSVGWPACPGGAGFDELGALRGASLHTNGALLLGGAELAAGTWCAEAAPAGQGARVLACAGAWRGEDEAHLPVYGVALAVGALFLAVTLAASLALPAAHHALHWRCQTHYVAALMLGDALLAGTQLAGSAVPPTLCRVLAVTMHFLFLSAFFWLNTMCFNIWWTFRDFRPTSVERGQEAWRLRVYSVYAWGAPLLLAGAGALLDALPGAAHLLRPRFGERRCWFAGDVEILAYFFGPVGLLLLINLALFASTTRQLTCGLWRRDEVKSTAERAALGRVCAKLVVVMGVTWGADVLSWAVGGPRYLWYATDLLNALQGVLIFLVVGCQRHALSALRARLRRGPGRPRPPHPLTHSSTQLPSCGESLTQTTPAPPPAGPPPPAPSLSQKVPMETVC